MKITIVTSEYGPDGGGLSYSCRVFQEILSEIGHDVTIVTSALNGDYIKGGYNALLGGHLAYESKLKQDEQALSNKELVIAFGCGFNGYYAALLAKKSRIPLWVMFRGSDANLAKWSMDICSFTSFAVDNASKIFALSEEIASNIRLITNTQKHIYIVPNAAPKNKCNVHVSSKNNIVIGTGASHLNEKKGISMLLKTLATVRAQNVDATLELVGEIDNDVKLQYVSIASKLGVSKYVFFLGRKSRDEFHKIQQTWSFYLQTSICEGMGNSVVDSISLGVPVILSNTGYVAEFFAERFPEIVVQNYNEVAFASAIVHVLSMDSAKLIYEKLYNEFLTTIDFSTVTNSWNLLLSGHLQNNSQIVRTLGVMSVVFHDVAGSNHDNITTPISAFQDFVEYVYKKGYILCSMKDYLQQTEEEQKKRIVCTFDDAYSGVFRNALPIMRRYNFSATVYVCTNYIGQSNDWNFKDKVIREHMNDNELTILLAHGWEIGSHGVTHRSLLRLNDVELDIEIKKSKQVLESKFGRITSYAYPYGDYSPFIKTIVAKEYKYAFALDKGGTFLKVDNLNIRRYFMSEIYQILG